VQSFQKLDNVKGKEGNELDEFWSHKFLESHGDTMTAIQMRNALKEIDIDCNKRMSFIEYGLWKYKQTVKELLQRPQGDNRAELEKAQAMLKAVQAAFDTAQKALSEAESDEAAAAAAKAELEVALAEVNAQQAAYDNTTADLKAKSEQGGQVAQNKAKAELAAHLNKPTLALSKAKITAEAAFKKAEKAANKATEARNRAQQAKQAAEKAVDEAEAYLDEVKRKSGGGQGSIWWLERELHEARAFLPERKGGYKKDK